MQIAKSPINGALNIPVKLAATGIEGQKQRTHPLTPPPCHTRHLGGGKDVLVARVPNNCTSRGKRS